MKNIDTNDFYPLSELFKAFSDVTRLRILSALTDSKLCVSELAETLNMTDSAISHQLKVLKQNHLVKGEREGKLIYYSLDDDHVRTMFMQGLEHIHH